MKVDLYTSFGSMKPLISERTKGDLSKREKSKGREASRSKLNKSK